MKASEVSLGFIGFGHMAQVIARSLLLSKLISHSKMTFVQRDPTKSRANQQAFGITSTTLETMAKEVDVLLLAVRPAQAEMVLKDLAATEPRCSRLISVLAGTKISFFQKFLGKDTEVLRVMPNLGSAVSEGMSVVSPSHNASIEFQSFGRQVFGCSGQVAEVAEKHMDLVCGMTGSCPGFVFRLIDTVARLGEKEGIKYEEALKMVAQAFVGAGKLIVQGGLPDKLVREIAVPNGTTEAGFHVMRNLKIEEHFQQVILAAAKRSQELSS